MTSIMTFIMTGTEPRVLRHATTCRFRHCSAEALVRRPLLRSLVAEPKAGVEPKTFRLVRFD